MANVFISHSSADGVWADKIYGWLKEDRHEVFLDRDQHDGIIVGDDWERRLYEQLRRADAVVCVVSDAYVESVWCAGEIGAARALGSELFPGPCQPGQRAAQTVEDDSGRQRRERSGRGANPATGPVAGDRRWRRLGMAGRAIAVSGTAIVRARRSSSLLRPQPRDHVHRRTASVTGTGAAGHPCGDRSFRLRQVVADPGRRASSYRRGGLLAHGSADRSRDRPARQPRPGDRRPRARAGHSLRGRLVTQGHRARRIEGRRHRSAAGGGR